MKRLLSIHSLILLALAFSHPVSAQNRTRFAGRFNAVNYAYGIAGNSAPAPLQVAVGTTATGSGTITLVQACTVLGDGTPLCPLNTNAPIIVGSGSLQETVTPSALSNCAANFGYQTCQVTATFTNLHGTGDNVYSGTVGLQETINAEQAAGGGAVVVDAGWTAAGGTSALIKAAATYSSVWIEDLRGTSNTYGNLYWTVQPSTLTSLAVPTTLVAGTVVFAAAPVGTWANSAYYFCVTYVDALGGEGPCSLTYTQTPTLNYSATITSPAASTGAVGWRFYAGTGSLATAYLLPITSANCTLTTLETVIPACAIGANGLFLAPNLTTTSLKPNTQTSPTINVNQTFPQGHTTFAYQPSAAPPAPFQTNFGAFVAYGSLTSGQIAIVGTAQLPAGYLNLIGRTIRVSGKLTLGSTNTATLPEITVSLGWAGGNTAGLPVPVCSFVTAAIGATAAANASFSCTMTTNAVGATAIGSIVTDGTMSYAGTAGAAGAFTIDTGTAAIGSLGLFSQNTLYVIYTSATNATAAPQLLDLHVETLL